MNNNCLSCFKTAHASHPTCVKCADCLSKMKYRPSRCNHCRETWLAASLGDPTEAKTIDARRKYNNWIKALIRRRKASPKILAKDRLLIWSSEQECASYSAPWCSQIWTIPEDDSPGPQDTSQDASVTLGEYLSFIPRYHES